VGRTVVEDPLGSGARPDPDDDEEDLEPVDDEFDPFAGRHVDPPPEEGEEGDDRVHAGS
jgi:hypothetical protein